MWRIPFSTFFSARFCHRNITVGPNTGPQATGKIVDMKPCPRPCNTWAKFQEVHIFVANQTSTNFQHAQQIKKGNQMIMKWYMNTIDGNGNMMIYDVSSHLAKLQQLQMWFEPQHFPACTTPRWAFFAKVLPTTCCPRLLWLWLCNRATMDQWLGSNLVSNLHKTISNLG